MTTHPTAWPDASPTRGGRLGLIALNAVAEARGSLSLDPPMGMMA